MTLFWVGALALTMLLYVVLDGFDLGIGMILGITRSEDDRRRMLATIAPVWDGNETWLVLAVVIIFGAFSKVYAALLSAFYLPIIMMLGALILRGVAFEFRNKTSRLRWVWDYAFTGGSIVATFMQGVMVGQLAQGLPLTDAVYTGSPLYWLNPFVYALATHVPIMNRWLERPWLAVFPLIGACAVISLLLHLRDLMFHRRLQTPDRQPFIMVTLLFLSAFATLAASFWPYMVPFSLTIAQAASPHASQAFMFWGAGIVFLPLTLFYAVFSYRVFGGKIVDEPEHVHS
jgi:cytochrome d ubiquinol oxidase subunit II